MVKCNDKNNEIVKEEREEICDLIFPFQDTGELSIPFLSRFKRVGSNYRSSHFNSCEHLGEHLKNTYYEVLF